uniref:Uncharacterized protein n=1 Tax=Cucumis melo TaxID=3656 RepID=A0A9I9E8M5_CUCME
MYMTFLLFRFTFLSKPAFSAVKFVSTISRSSTKRTILIPDWKTRFAILMSMLELVGLTL